VVHAVAPPALYVPAAHEVQDENPVPAAYVPAAQLEQAVVAGDVV
jgi:hypothetical protein